MRCWKPERHRAVGSTEIWVHGAFVSFDHRPAARVTFGTTHAALGLDFNADHLAVKETDVVGNLSRTKRFVLLREDAASGPRNFCRRHGRCQRVRKHRGCKDFDFTAKKKAMSQVSPKGARVLSGLLYAKY